LLAAFCRPHTLLCRFVSNRFKAHRAFAPYRATIQFTQQAPEARAIRSDLQPIPQPQEKIGGESASEHFEIAPVNRWMG
jgi:hypothetical protein